MIRSVSSHGAGVTGSSGGDGAVRCPFGTMAGAYCDGELDTADLLRFQRHLDRCDGCTRDVERVRELSEWFGPARALEPHEAVLGRLHESVALLGDFDKRRRMKDALPAARMTAALAASVLIVAGAWLFDGAGAPATPKTLPLAQSIAQAQPWERTALTLEVDPPTGADGFAPDQQRLVDWMVASLDRPEHP